MIVGHAFLAFALCAGVALKLGWDGRTARHVGLIAAAFALLPDVDMVYALTGIVGVVGGQPDGPLSIARSFWGASTVVHRAGTHSLLLAAPAAVAFTLWAVPVGNGRPTSRLVRLTAALALLLGLCLLVLVVDGTLAVTIIGLYVLVGLGFAALVRRFLTVNPWAILGAIYLGLVSHPFGDVFTGTPPRFFYPLPVSPMAEIFHLHPDPTLHLLYTFALELVTIWVAFRITLRTLGDEVQVGVYRYATIGLGFVLLVPILQEPTIHASYHFVFPVVGIGVLTGLIAYWTARRRERYTPLEVALTTSATGLRTTLLAFGSYALVYLLTNPQLVLHF